jgi:threonine/homoserine/homoserine lactone efflux protein
MVLGGVVGLTTGGLLYGSKIQIHWVAMIGVFFIGFVGIALIYAMSEEERKQEKEIKTQRARAKE